MPFVVKCLERYEIATTGLRPNKNGAKPLFISYTKPHRPVSSQHIAHWIKEMLGRAGVDTNTFKAHSVHGASTYISCHEERGAYYRHHEYSRLEF